MINRLEMQQTKAVTHSLKIQEEASSAGLRHKKSTAATDTLEIKKKVYSIDLKHSKLQKLLTN